MSEDTDSLASVDTLGTEHVGSKPEISKYDDIKPRKNGDIQPVKNGEIQPVKNGNIQPVKYGKIQPVIGQPVDNGDVKPCKVGDMTTGIKGDIQYDQDGDIEPHKEGSVDPGKDGGIMGGAWRRVISRRRGATCSVEVIARLGVSEASVSAQKVHRQFCTGSYCRGQTDALGMEGECIYTMPHDVAFDGEIHDGHFHGIGTLIYPNSCRIDGTFNTGKLDPATYTFRDGLVFEERNWTYCSCIRPDRRFQQEIKFGLRPVCTSLKTQGQPTRKIPKGCYDTGDGFFSPKTRCVTSETGGIIRIPTETEVQWIEHNCRKSWDEVAGPRRDMFDSLNADDVNYAPLLMEKRRRSLLGHQKSSEDKRMRQEFCRLIGI